MVLQTRGLSQPFAAPESGHYPNGFKDPQNHWVSLYNGYNMIGYNTKLVSKINIPNGWEDLESPLEGKIGHG